MSVSISYPFTLNNGKVETTSSATKIYTDRVLTLLSTNIGQRPILQAYGADMDYALFENDNNLTLAVQSAAGEALKKWIPKVGLSSVNVSLVDSNGNSDVEIIVNLPDNTNSSLSINSSSFGYSGTVTG
jgi:phage baseplate assembly protein W